MKTKTTVITILMLTSYVFGFANENKSIILWPDYDWVGGGIEAVADQYLDDGDHLVYPYYRGTVGSFRSSQYNVDKEKVLLQVYDIPSIPFVKHDYPKNQEGIGGIFSVITDSSVFFNADRFTKDSIEAIVQENDQKVVYFLDRNILAKNSNIEFLAKNADALVIFDKRALTGEEDAFERYYKKIAEKAMSYNPDAKLYCGLQFRIEDNTPEDVLEKIALVLDNFDGFMLRFENTDNHIETLEEVLKVL